MEMNIIPHSQHKLKTQKIRCKTKYTQFGRLNESQYGVYAIVGKDRQELLPNNQCCACKLMQVIYRLITTSPLELGVLRLSTLGPPR